MRRVGSRGLPGTAAFCRPVFSGMRLLAQRAEGLCALIKCHFLLRKNNGSLSAARPEGGWTPAVSGGLQLAQVWTWGCQASGLTE